MVRGLSIGERVLPDGGTSPAAWLAGRKDAYRNRSVRLHYGDHVFETTLGALGVELDVNATVSEAAKVLKRYSSLKDSVKALSELSNQTVKNKCYLLAADIAMSSGDVDEAEDAMLDAMQRVLQVEDALATKILEVLTLKYARS